MDPCLAGDFSGDHVCACESEAQDPASAWTGIRYSKAYSPALLCSCVLYARLRGFNILVISHWRIYSLMYACILGVAGGEIRKY